MRRPLRLFVVGLLAALLLAVCIPPDALAALPDAGTVIQGAASVAILPLLGIRPMLDADNGAGSGGSGGSGSGLSRADVEAMIKGKLGEGATERQIQMVTDLTMRASKAEAERDATKTQLAAAQAKTPEGAVVLTGDEAKAYTTLRAREGAGETPLKAAADALATATTDAAELAKLRASKSLTDAIAAEQAAGTALNQLALETYVPGLKTEVADHVGTDGKAVKRAFAVVEKDGGPGVGPVTSKVLLADFLKTEHAALLPALTATPSPAPAGTQGGTAQRGAFPATPTAATHAPSGTEDMVGDFLTQHAAAVRPSAAVATPVAQA